MIGHSLGGMVSINSVKSLKNIKGGIALDASVDPSILGLQIDHSIYDPTQEIDKPFMHILAGNHEKIYAQSPLCFKENENTNIKEAHPKLSTSIISVQKIIFTLFSLNVIYYSLTINKNECFKDNKS
jgi:hypothetical protein